MAVSSSVCSRLGSRLMVCELEGDWCFEEEEPCVGTGKRSGIWRPRAGKDWGVSERLERERAASSSSSGEASDLGCLPVGALAVPFERWNCLSSPSCLICCCCCLGSGVGERNSDIQSQAMEVEVRATR